MDELKQGVVIKRSCTDVFMCIVFVIFFCGLFATAGYGYANGDPSKLITPFDSSGISTKLICYRELMW